MTVGPPQLDKKLKSTTEQYLVSLLSVVQSAHGLAFGSKFDLVFTETIDDHSFKKRLRDIGLDNQWLTRRELRQVQALANYWRICLYLSAAARFYRSSFKELHLDIVMADVPEVWPDQNGTRYFVHAEIQLLVRHELTPHLPKPRTISASKKACWLCSTFIRSYGVYDALGSHGEMHWQWTIPNRVDYTRDQRASMRAALAMTVQATKQVALNRNRVSSKGPPQAQSVLNLRIPKFTKTSLLSLLSNDLHSDKQPLLATVVGVMGNQELSRDTGALDRDSYALLSDGRCGVTMPAAVQREEVQDHSLTHEVPTLDVPLENDVLNSEDRLHLQEVQTDSGIFYAEHTTYHVSSSLSLGDKSTRDYLKRNIRSREPSLRNDISTSPNPRITLTERFLPSGNPSDLDAKNAEGPAPPVAQPGQDQSALGVIPGSVLSKQSTALHSPNTKTCRIENDVLRRIEHDWLRLQVLLDKDDDTNRLELPERHVRSVTGGTCLVNSVRNGQRNPVTVNLSDFELGEERTYAVDGNDSDPSFLLQFAGCQDIDVSLALEL